MDLPPPLLEAGRRQHVDGLAPSATQEYFSPPGRCYRLFACTWAPTASSCGAVFILHGLQEHCLRYALLAEGLAAAGYWVHGLDHVGFGRSEGRRGGLGNLPWEAFVEDAAAFVEHARASYAQADLPLFLFGRKCAVAYA